MKEGRSCHFNSFFLPMIEEVKLSYMVFNSLKTSHIRDEIANNFKLAELRKPCSLKVEKMY